MEFFIDEVECCAVVGSVAGRYSLLLEHFMEGGSAVSFTVVMRGETSFQETKGVQRA